MTTSHEPGSTSDTAADARSTGPESDGTASAAPNSPLAFPAPPEPLEELMAAPLTPQKRFTVPKASWIRKFGEIPHASDAIAGLPAWMNRDSAIAAFSSHWPDDPVGAFTATMAWAYGERAGYAGYRVARILTASSRPEGREENPRVRTALRTSLEVAMRDGAVEGFSYLNDCTHKVKSHQGTDADLLVGVDCGRIYGLGPSFFTKWLHIGTLALSQESTSTHPPAPMLDSQTTAWLNTHARIVDEDCLAQDEAQKAAVIHRKWHADASSPECTDHCLFLGADEARRDAGGSHTAGTHADGPFADRAHADGAHTDRVRRTPTTPEGDLLRLRAGRTDDYSRYIDLLSAWGEPYGLRAVDVSDRIYRLIRDDGEQDSRVTEELAIG